MLIKIKLVALLLVITATLNAQPPKSATPADAIFVRAVQLHQAGDLENAIKQYQLFLAHHIAKEVLANINLANSAQNVAASMKLF